MRLRIGHTFATHAHLLNGTSKPECPFCRSAEFNVIHILDTCSEVQQTRYAIFGNGKPSDHLKLTHDSNINLITKFISLCKLKIWLFFVYIHISIFSYWTYTTNHIIPRSLVLPLCKNCNSFIFKISTVILDISF